MRAYCAVGDDGGVGHREVDDRQEPQRPLLLGWLVDWLVGWLVDWFVG